MSATGVATEAGGKLAKMASAYTRGRHPLEPPAVVAGSASRTARDAGRSPYEPVLYTAAHDHKLLQTPHPVLTKSGSVVQTPACVYGTECVARRGVFGFKIPGMPADGLTLRADMSPSELEAFEADGIIPENARPCIVCSRTATLTSYYHNLFSGTTHPNVCIQAHCSPVDCDNGYSSQFCIFPTERGTYGLVAPLVYFDMSGMRAVRRQLQFDTTSQGPDASYYYQVEVLYTWSGRKYAPAAGAELPSSLDAARPF